jgi:hypothetical protein
MHRKRQPFDQFACDNLVEHRLVNIMKARLGRISFVAAGVVIAASALVAQESGYLDLTEPLPRQRFHNPSANGGTGGFGICGGNVSSIPELTLVLASLDKFRYSVGEDVTFEVRVENTGTVSVDMPWTPHLGDLEPVDPTHSYSYSEALLHLNFLDTVSHRSFGAGHLFYGSHEVPGTLRELLPKQSIMIRARSRIEQHEDWLVKRLEEAQPLPLVVSPDLMLNAITYFPHEREESASESYSCVPLNTKKDGQVGIILWPSRPI